MMALNRIQLHPMTEQLSKSLVSDLNLVTERFIMNLPLIFSIFGIIGFIGNSFTYLRPELRTNTCCIYSLCGSIVDILNIGINLFPNYLAFKYGIYIPWYQSSATCKTNIFLLVFIPHLSINFLLMAIIDRYACTCSLTARIRKLNQLKMIPWTILITIITSFLATCGPFILYELKYGICLTMQPELNSILYIIIIGVMQPAIMLIFVLLSYCNVRQTHRRVGIVTGSQRRSIQNQFVVMVCCQVLVTGFLAIQWIVMFIYFTFADLSKNTYEQTTIVFFVFFLTNNVYYLNNVKSFYISLATSGLFRKTLLKGLIKMLRRSIRPRIQPSDANPSMATVTKMRKPEIIAKCQNF